MYDVNFMRTSFPPDRYLSALFTPQSRPAARAHGSKGLGPDSIKVPTGERLYDMLWSDSIRYKDDWVKGVRPYYSLSLIREN